ncbi:peptidylprolyl isomerase [Halopseudomonas phragmitis]|uniref:Peptidyl-prolyl cis-trans isomerase n=2 Tax=Pseudomonadaceae TaxID=135621 RepID=A0A1V0B616_9GAMM|nr:MULTISPECIES: peptidylprolyl isomerase [Pseudomonadaceae]AQZ95224.1 peptidylprolyl isomerase [Halopseudomonas phragmitis]RHW22065.1 peptidylprolyl isomerase [Pseudomonas jilinensis]
MQIANNTVVQFHYTLSDASGEIESSYKHEPVLYLHGQAGLIDGLVEALEGRQAGDSFSVTIPAEKAYGQPRENATQKVQVKYLQGAKKWKPGMVAVLQTERGPVQVTVTKVGLKQVEVDTNHPLAGKELTFAIEILDVRAATEEEIAHGHAHGVGGHQH